MPPPLLLDINSLDLSRVLITREEIYTALPHRHEFMLLDGVVYHNEQTGAAVAYHDVREDEFWVRGHLPGRSLFPGVLMIEAAGQLGAFMAAKFMGFEDRFYGLGGLGGAKFRDTVLPNCRMHILVSPVDIKPRRIIFASQGVIDGKIVLEVEIHGMPV